MDTTEFVVHWMILILGLSYIFQARQWALFSLEAVDKPHRRYPFIIVFLVWGLVLVRTHNDWSVGPDLVVTSSAGAWW